MEQKELKIITEQVKKITIETENAQKYGKEVGKRIVKKFKRNSDINSTILSSILYEVYKNEQSKECGELFKRWTEEKFWGKIVESNLPKINEIWKILNKRKHNKNNKFGYGDADADVWVEYPKTEHPKENPKVIIHKSYCTFADDDTHIFIIRDNTLHIRTVWNRENNRGGYQTAKGWFYWGDDRDIKIPSLNTYRKRNFKFGYNDDRDYDKGYVLTMEKYPYINEVKIDGAGVCQHRINHAIWLIDMILNQLEQTK